MTPDFGALHAAAARCSAAYIMDQSQAFAAFEALGEKPLAQYRNADHQAVLCEVATAQPDPPGGGCTPARYRLTISGTRFSQLQLPDLFDDIDNTPADLGDGVMVTRGAFRGCDRLWAWALGIAAPGSIIDVEGHSLGGWRARYTPIFLPEERQGELITFESPKGANVAYWTKYDHRLRGMISVVNARDLWVGWPWVGDWHHPPDPFCWLTGGSYRMVTEKQWPGGRDTRDHDIATIVSLLAALAAPRAA